MRNGLKLVVLTSSSVAAGTVIEHLLRSTDAQIARVYFDTQRQPTRAKGRVKKKRKQLSFARRLWYHLCLARVRPRHYFFDLARRLSGRSELEVLRLAERLSPRLLGVLCGFAVRSRVGRGRVLWTLDEVVREHRLELVQTDNLNDRATVNALKSDNADVIIGIGTRILSGNVLASARVGVLNAHSSLLPDYRGGTSEFWQLAFGETRTGVTIHWMAERVDEGAICAQASWPIPARCDHEQLRLLSLLNRLKLWQDVIQRIANGECPAQEQGVSRLPTFKHPSLSQLHTYYCRGMNPLDNVEFLSSRRHPELSRDGQPAHSRFGTQR